VLGLVSKELRPHCRIWRQHGQNEKNSFCGF
jgi:hypothetical protein